MSKEQYLSTAQAMRSAQLKMTHKSLTALEEAAANAIVYQGKYMTALNNLISCMLDCSDSVEQTRALFGADGAARMTPTFEVTGQLARSFEAWRRSAELLKLKQDFDALTHVCTVAKRTARIAEEQEEQVMKYAARCAKKAARVRPRRSSQTSSPIAPQRASASYAALTAKMEELDSAFIETSKSLGVWWSGKLAQLATSMTEDMARLGGATVRFYASPPLQRERSVNIAEPFRLPRTPGVLGTAATASNGRATHFDAAAMNAAAAATPMDEPQGMLISHASSWQSSAATSAESSIGAFATPALGPANADGSAVRDSRVYAH